MKRGENAVMSRKVRGPKMRLSGFPVLEPLCSAFATICATQARQGLSTDADVELLGYESLRHGDYLQQIDPSSAIHVLAFPESGHKGLVRAETRLFEAVVDLSLGADEAAGLAAERRAPTVIDISIYRRFVDLMAGAFHDATVEICGRSAIGRASPDRFESRPGMVRIAPDRAQIFLIRLAIRIGGAADATEADFVLPVAALELLRDDLARMATTDESLVELWEKSMREQVTGIRLATDCVIDLGDFSVGELSRLEQGALLELPQEAMAAIELRVATIGGEVAFARGRLGAIGRHKAVRLVEDPDQGFLDPLRSLLDQPAI